MFTSWFRLWFDKESDTVKLMTREKHVDEELILAESYSNNSTELRVSDYKIRQSYNKTFAILYGVYFSALQANEGTKRHTKHSVHTDPDRRFVYVQNGITLTNGNITHAGNYLEDVLNDSWRKEYMLTSKRNRASFTAMNNIIPMDISEIQLLTARSKGLKYFSNRTEAVNLIMTTPKPNGEDIIYLRTLIPMHFLQKGLRKHLQKLINEKRYDRAEKEGAITTINSINYPK